MASYIYSFPSGCFKRYIWMRLKLDNDPYYISFKGRIGKLWFPTRFLFNISSNFLPSWWVSAHPPICDRSTKARFLLILVQVNLHQKSHLAKLHQTDWWYSRRTKPAQLWWQSGKTMVHHRWECSRKAGALLMFPLRKNQPLRKNCLTGSKPHHAKVGNWPFGATSLRFAKFKETTKKG